MNLKQLSDHLGLSQTTVSRALNGYPEVSESTRERVQLEADRVGYRPNARARGLATGRAQAIGHVLPVSAQHEMVNPVFGDFIAGAGETYLKSNYDLQLSLVPDGEEEAAYRRLATTGTVDGIIVHGPRMDDPRIGLLHELGLPFVVHGRASNEALPYSWLDVDNYRAFHRATQFLAELGHRKIALINGLEFMDFAHRRRQGYLSALEAAGITPRDDLMSSAEMTEVNGHHAMRDMLNRPDPPTAVLTSSLILAIGARRALDEAGLQLARDVSIITHDDDLSYLRNGQDEAIFTATRSSVRDAGRIVAEMVLERIDVPDAPPRTVMMEAELIIGRSTGPCPTP
ncbi:substrate-binding domain-containing protein [Pseudaestuariivita atlantica]|uniref:LacI family transcriptional regulator n=1 Tax=Pseudaestuariivita atlantica TaxID=1317121 RepID=A0A0L1JW06_9RHOB|nr:substrate-binding domain-containing protein [Pseudaestuariivita atlantica]KNG95588.1 LacI family transcriptional regulator [Pseudaestuariivita atlantica]